MRFTSTLGLALFGLCTLTADVRRVAAQELTATFTGVTFSDGAVATGYFNYNPAMQLLGGFSITTTNGLTDTLTGGHYAPGLGTVTSTSYDSSFNFSTPELPPSFIHNFLGLGTTTHITGPGVYLLFLGTDVTPTSFNGSGEFAPAGTAARGVTAGTLVVTNVLPAAVPEASGTISLGLLLALGLGSVAAARKKRLAA